MSDRMRGNMQCEQACTTLALSYMAAHSLGLLGWPVQQVLGWICFPCVIAVQLGQSLARLLALDCGNPNYAAVTHVLASGQCAADLVLSQTSVQGRFAASQDSPVAPHSPTRCCRWLGAAWLAGAGSCSCKAVAALAVAACMQHQQLNKPRPTAADMCSDS